MRNFRKFALAMLCVFGIGHSQAATFNIGLSGVVDDGVFSTFESGGLRYDYWTLDLGILDPSILVSSGDSVNATITLDRSVTMPASVTYSYFDLSFFGTFSNADTGTQGTTSFFNGGVPGLTDSGGTTTSGELSHALIAFPPNNGVITFDMVTSNFVITQLDAPVEVDGASIAFLRVSPVPEPETYALLLAGLGLIGSAVRRRKA